MSRKKILIVDDHPDFREFFAFVLEQSGYAVVKARTGLEAVDRARATSPDLIFVDFGLSDITGDKVILRLKADPATEKIPVILLTGYSDTKVTDLAIAAGAAKVLIKPFDLDNLREAIQQCLSSEPDNDPQISPANIRTKPNSE